MVVSFLNKMPIRSPMDRLMKIAMAFMEFKRILKVYSIKNQTVGERFAFVESARLPGLIFSSRMELAKFS
jgi:hypothetical protein